MQIFTEVVTKPLRKRRILDGLNIDMIGIIPIGQCQINHLRHRLSLFSFKVIMRRLFDLWVYI